MQKRLAEDAIGGKKLGVILGAAGWRRFADGTGQATGEHRCRSLLSCLWCLGWASFMSCFTTQLCASARGGEDIWLERLIDRGEMSMLAYDTSGQVLIPEHDETQ